MKRLALLLFASSFLFADATPAPAQEELVTVPKKYVSAEGLSKTATGGESIEKLSGWISIGKEVGLATREGLRAVVDEANHFGTTKVGTFVMAVVAWKILGKDLMGVVIGVPLLVIGISLWVWSYRNFFVPKRSLTKHDEANKVKTWSIVQYEFETREGKTVCACAHFFGLIAWLVGMLVTIF